ncbi:MAG: hypothetical protein ACRD5Z_15395 [Bryobacteraceae bacterium]
MKSSLSSSGILIVETASRCTAATSVTAIALLGRLDPTSSSADLPGNNAWTRNGGSTIRKNPAALQYRLSTAGLDSFEGVRQFDIDQVNDPLTGKTMPRLANKSFGQAYFYMSLFGSSSAGNGPSWAQYGPELSNQ